MTSRERVCATLDRRLTGRVPRQLWRLGWAQIHHAAEVAELDHRYPPDIVAAPMALREPLRTEGEEQVVGRFVDEWGATFVNIQAGVIGEVQDPVVSDWGDTRAVRLPEERLSVEVDQVNAFCRETDRFVLAPLVARPFERLQFLRGSENLFVDLLDRPPGFLGFLRRMHDFYCRELELWAGTDVDGLFFMDDWGGQRSLLVSPLLWRELFKPLYHDYVAIAHAAGKRAFMHSDGHILEIYPDLVELGVDALNSQIHCMGIEALAAFRGRITFWGEVDRQHLLARAPVREVARAVELVYGGLYDRGGIIAQCEFGAGARPENVAAVFETWDRLTV